MKFEWFINNHDKDKKYRSKRLSNVILLLTFYSQQKEQWIKMDLLQQLVDCIMKRLFFEAHTTGENNGRVSRL